MTTAYFLLTAHDAPDAAERRQANRAEHVARVTQAQANGVVKLGGPLLDDNGQMTGSFMVFALPTRQAVEDWIETDCYVLDHVWSSWTIQSVGIAPCFL
jgi:uncharacterized protein